MSRLKLILTITLPGLRIASALLASKDANDSGVDDETAQAISYAADRIEKFLSTPEPVPA